MSEWEGPTRRPRSVNLPSGSCGTRVDDRWLSPSRSTFTGSGKALPFVGPGPWCRGRCPTTPGALLDAGGDLIGRSPAVDGQDWLVGIEHPLAPESPIAVVALARGAVCTSSIRVSNWTNATGGSVHHLIDPATRRPGGEGLLSVTVAGPDPSLGRGVDEGLVPVWAGWDRRAGSRPRARGVVGR